MSPPDHRQPLTDLAASTLRVQLDRLNHTLAALELTIRAEVQRLESQLLAKVADPEDWLADYEIEVQVQCYLRAEDAAYQEDEDNLLVVLKEPGKGRDQAWYVGDGQNHNTFAHWDHPLRYEHHCWLYHCLYDHTALTWHDLTRIGSLWVEVNVNHQGRCILV